MSHSILLVDDEEGIRTVLGLSLADAGYRVTTAATGEEALRLFDQTQPDIVLTDIKMPGLSGLDLLARIKKQSPETEVIMITGHGDMDLAIQSLKQDATDFITKPINDDVLEIALSRANERISMRAQLRDYTENLENKVREQSARLVEAERQLAAQQMMDGFSVGLKALLNAMDSAMGGVFNELPCFVAVHSRYLEIISANDLYRERLGNLVGHQSWEAYYGRDKESNGCPVLTAIREGRGSRTEEMLIDKHGNGIPVLVHTAPILDNDGEVELVLEISVDTSEARRLHEELRLTRHRYGQLFEEAPCYITVQDKQFRVVEANRRFREDFGNAVGGFCHDVFVHRKTPCSGCPVQRTFIDGQPHQYETVVTSRSGEQYNVLVWTAPLRDANGNIIEVMEMSTNITELRRLQDRLSNLGLLLGSTAHGIKGLLTALDGGIYRLGSGLERGNTERIEDSYNDVKHLTDRLRKMVLDLLYYSKKRALNWEMVVTSHFTSEVAALVQPKAEAQNIKFTVEVEPDAGTFEADSGALSAAFVNLLENAVEACVADKSKEEHEVLLSVTGLSDRVEFLITDNGTGMDRETREKLFTLFFSSKGAAGTGIGLFVASQTVQQHGGTISVGSEPQQGTTFVVSLPRVLSDSAKENEENAGAGNGAQAVELAAG
ncbi:response regulator [Oleidesulfovibrio sp.]|uniref:hybrid sensor histidine kinase/response regulator n=1 Tax=Oleidesulfovibrio sp. TaxID=2909707 RepID=UPI003A87FBBC